MRVETYSHQYFLDVENLVVKFYKEYLTEYTGEADLKRIDETINLFNGENSKNAFLLIHADKFNNSKCVGLLAGVEIKSHLNDERFFQEIIWFVEKPFGRYGFYLLNQTKIMLKSFGFNSIIMSVLENPKSSRIKKIYERMGFKLMETHYAWRL